MRPVVKCVLVSALFVPFVAAADAVTPKTQKASTNSTPAMMQMPMVVPLFLEDGDFTSTLVLVNGGAVQTYADVAVRALSGKIVATSRVQFQPHSLRQVNIRKLLDSSNASGITAGSITVMQSSALSGMVITAALSMTRLSSSPSYIDEEIAMPSAEGSQILRAVADKGEGSPIVAITSLSDMGQHVQLQCLAKNGTRFSKTVAISAGETLLTEACSEGVLHGADFQRYAEDSRDEVRGPIGIALKSDGMPGSFAAFALAPHGSRDKRYFSSVAFTDPMMVMSTTTVFTGVPVGSAAQLPAGAYTPTVALANFANQDAHVTVRYAQTSGDTPNTQDVASTVVPAQSSKEVSLPSLKGDPYLQNSFLIVADEAPGDVVAKLVTRSDSQLREVELLGKDLKDPQNGGNHPWSIENGTDSTLLLFNTSSVPQYFNVSISAGSTVWRKAYQLQPMQTKAISVRDLIKQKVKDDKGNLLPSEIWTGQVQWHVPNPNAGRGRVLESNPEKAMARNFSCGFVAELCEGDFSGVNYLMDGQTINFGQIFPQVCANTCSGTPVGPGGDGYSYSWSPEDTSIASISGSSTDQSVDVFGTYPGYTSIDAYASDGFCTAYVQPTPPAPVVPAVTFSALQGVAQGGSATVTVSLARATSSPVPIVLSLSTTSGTGSATFSTGGTTQSISTNTTVTINGVTASSAVNNIKLDAVPSGGSQSVASPPLTFSVVKVDLSLQPSGMIPSTDPGTSTFLDGSSSLGPRIVYGLQANQTFCLISFQVTGTVTPTNYAGPITLRRTVTANGWTDPGGTSFLSKNNADDTSNPPLLNYIPSIGQAFDLDGPGTAVGLSDSIGTVNRIRANFDEYAVLGDRNSTTKVSTQDLIFYSRSSCGKISASPGTQFDPTYPGDNQIGMGTTPLSDNLQ